MEVKVELNNLRTAPRKTRQVADVIRNKNLAQARALLEFTIKRPADPMLKLLNSAIASALNDFHLEESNLYVSQVMVDEGPKLKRSHPMSRGRAYPIIKRTSHITLILGEINSKKGNNKKNTSKNPIPVSIVAGNTETKLKKNKIEKSKKIKGIKKTSK